MLNGPAVNKPPRRRLPGVDVRPGSVRQARLEAGLSLAELAGGRVTRAAIHLIETGRSRPSMPVLEMIADRTGRPVSWFLDPSARLQGAGLEQEARISELESLCEAQDYESARALAEELLAAGGGEQAEARVRHYLGRSLVRLHEPEQALPHLRRALLLFEAMEDGWMAVETMDWLAGAMNFLEDPGAVALEEEALQRCRALDPVPGRTEIRIMTNLATVYAQRHEWTKAAKLYEQVLERGREMQDMGRLARVYHGLGVAYRNLGDLNRSVTYTQRAVAFHSLERDKAAVCQAEEALGRLLLRHDDLAGAEAHLGRALEQAKQLGLDHYERHARLGLAQVYLKRGELDPALGYAQVALEQARRDGAQVTEAEAHGVLGSLKAAAGDGAAADDHFSTAIRVLEATGVTEQLIEVRHTYARVLKERGDTAGALAQLEAAMALTRPALVAREAAGRRATRSAPAS